MALYRKPGRKICGGGAGGRKQEAGSRRQEAGGREWAEGRDDSAILNDQ